MVTVASLFADNVASDPARPCLTWYGPDERTELSGATLANWVAKTANLLVDELGLGPSDVAAVKLPPHWQTSSIMLACWTAGLSISHSDSVTADVTFGLPGTECDYAVGLHPFAVPVPDPSPASDWVLAARAHGDHYGGPPAREDALALSGLPTMVTHGDLARRALARAKELGIERGEGGRARRAGGREEIRVLIDIDAHPRPLDYLVAPIAAGASLVLCQGVESVEKIAATERATIVGRP
ncbi:TIGR03089 family protein [Allorhizocola rhizosphaerae]|uniref:TIGR03089 family protein n=1 Tax=Allorhizocola rhizosphaerae TaxID=1872709 RepID=UPI000E3EBF71|nr:TIGR03089 family protein [Allorhizocola rhizosphaerae]